MDQKEIEKIITRIATYNTRDFKCYNVLRNLLKQDNIYNIIQEGLDENKIMGFPEELWIKLDNQNLRAPGVNSFIEVFRDGYNLGYCTVAAKQVSYSLDNCYICGGTVKVLEGTINSPDGSHTWIEYKNFIIDTTLMLLIDKEYALKLGYNEENRYNPNEDEVYKSTKEFTNDKSLKKR